MNLRASALLCPSQDYVAGLAIAEVELTAANIRDVDRRSFDVNTPFKNFWYVGDLRCASALDCILKYYTLSSNG